MCYISLSMSAWTVFAGKSSPLVARLEVAVSASALSKIEYVVRHTDFRTEYCGVGSCGPAETFQNSFLHTYPTYLSSRKVPHLLNYLFSAFQHTFDVLTFQNTSYYILNSVQFLLRHGTSPAPRGHLSESTPLPSLAPAFVEDES